MGQTVNKQYYLSVMQLLREANSLKKIRTFSFLILIMHQHDTRYDIRYRLDTISTDLAPSIFWLLNIIEFQKPNLPASKIRKILGVNALYPKVITLK